MRLSIIVPAYKVEKYIEKCIRSLENQDISPNDYEIIITNDGSPDNCKSIVEKLQLEFNNIILINQENQGVSVARNNAIAEAKGKYIMPIDPDDYVLPNTFKHILTKVEKDDLDVLYLGFEIFNAQEKSIWHTDFSIQEKNTYDGVEGYFASRGFHIKDPDRSWAILYRKEMIDTYKLQYPKNVPFLEDGLFISKVFAVAQKVGFDNSKFYQRTTSEGSATVSGVYYSDKAITGFITAVKDIKQFSNANKLSQKQLELVNHVVAKYTILSLTSVIGQRNFLKYLKLLKTLKINGLHEIKNEGLRNDYIKLTNAFNFNSLFFYVYYLFYSKLKTLKK